MSTTNENYKNPIVVGDGTTTAIPLQFIYPEDNQDYALSVIMYDGVNETETVLVEGVDYTVASGTLTLTTALAIGFNLHIERVTTNIQRLDYVEQEPFPAEVTESLMDRIMLSLSELKGKASRSFSASPFSGITNFLVPTPEDGTVLGWDASGNLENKPDPTASALAAAASAAAASTSETNAAASETAALAAQTGAELAETNAMASELASAASAADALAAAQSSRWQDVEYLTAADSPVNIIALDNGTLFRIDTSAGNVIVNLPDRATLDLSLPWQIGVLKSSSDTNTITINADTGETIDGGTSVSVSILDSGFALIPDDDSDAWSSIPYASATGGSGSPSKIEGTGGKVVTDAADMIGAGDGMVGGSAASWMQMQNAAGTQAYIQGFSDQIVYSSNLARVYNRMAASTLTATGNVFANKTLVSMSAPGQTANLINFNNGYRGSITMTGGVPFKAGTTAAKFIGKPDGVEFTEIGDTLFYQQISASEYAVLGFYKAGRIPKGILEGFELDVSDWTFTAGTGATGGSIARNTTLPLAGVSDLKVVTTKRETSGSLLALADQDFIERDFVLSNEVEKSEFVNVKFDLKYPIAQYSASPTGGDQHRDFLTVAILDQATSTVLDSFEVFNIDEVALQDKKYEVSCKLDASGDTTGNLKVRLYSYIYDPSVESLTLAPEYQIDNFRVETEEAYKVGNEKLDISLAKNSAQNVSNAVFQTLIYNVENKNQGGHYNTTTGIFTAPRAMTVNVNAHQFFSTITFSVGQAVQGAIYINGVQQDIQRSFTAQVTQATLSNMVVNKTVRLQKGDELEVRIYQNTGGGRATYTGGSDEFFNTLKITEV